MKDLPSVKQMEIHHCKQNYNWDCGISCVLMVLPEEKRLHLQKGLKDIGKQEGFNKSTWTIDLCYLLQRYDVRHVFYTVTLGVDPQYKNSYFYEKIVLKDEERVLKKFKEAPVKGIEVIKKSISIIDIVRHLNSCGPVIVLIDAVHLRCETCKMSKFSNEIQKYLNWVSSYHGHYVVLCGFDIKKKIIFYRNPSVRNSECLSWFMSSSHLRTVLGICQISFLALDKARTSHGTDEDIILIYQ